MGRIVAIVALALGLAGCGTAGWIAPPVESKTLVQVPAPLTGMTVLVREVQGQWIGGSNAPLARELGLAGDSQMRGIAAWFQATMRAELDGRAVRGFAAEARQLPDGTYTAAGDTSPLQGPVLLVEFRKSSLQGSVGHTSLRGQVNLVVIDGRIPIWTATTELLHSSQGLVARAEERAAEARRTATALAAIVGRRLEADGLVPKAGT